MKATAYILLAGIFAVALIVLSGLFGSFYTIDAGDRGVILRNGKVIGTADPGLHFKLPFVDDVKTVDVRDGVRTFDNLAAYSKDQQTATMRVTVNYRVLEDSVAQVYSTYGSVEAMLARVVDPKVFESTKEVFGKFNAVSAIQERGKLGVDAEAAITGSISGPLVITSIQIENVDFSDAYERSIEERMLAEVEVQKVLQNVEREKATALITVTQAKAAADGRLAQATAEAEAIRLTGNAEADAIKARAAALAKNPELVELTKAERWDGVLPTSMIPGSAVPFIEVARP